MKFNLLRIFDPSTRASWVLGVMAMVAWPMFIDNVNSDGICYLTLARKYAHLDFGNALNAYWSPLISWLLAPGIALGIPELVWQKLLAIVLGMAGLRAQFSLWRKVGLSSAQAEWAGYASVPMWLLIVFEAITPEPAMMLILVLYFLFYLKGWGKPSFQAGLLWGLFGGLGYWSKAYFFPFFLAHLAISGVLFLAKSSNFPLSYRLRYLLGAALCFILTAGPWVGVISLKQGHFTLSEASRYNAVKYELVGDGSHLMEQIGLVPPPNSLAVSVWEDITPYIPSASPTLSLQERAKEMVLNTGKALRIFSHKNLAFGVVGLLIMLALLRKPEWWDEPWFHLVFASGIYVGGYLLILVVDRYLWWIPLLTIGMSVQVWAWLPDFFKTTKLQRVVACLFLLLTSGLMPVYQLSKVAGQGEVGMGMGEAVRQLPGFEPGTIASDAGYYPSTFLAYMADAPYFGQLKYLPTTSWEAALEKHHIRWFFCWETPPAYLLTYREITRLPINGLRVFDLHTPTP